jgi:hypothetical protein
MTRKPAKSTFIFAIIAVLLLGGVFITTDSANAQEVVPYVVVDTGQTHCYSNNGAIDCAGEGNAFFGQDAQYQGTPAAYVDNNDGTITDLNTGLMWQQDPGSKMTWNDAMAGTDSFTLAGYSDWRMPTIKELYSLMNFDGITGFTAASSTPYLNTDYFIFEYGNETAGERMIDAQFWSSTEYVSTTMNGNHTVFGVNFADGRIKGYGTSGGRGEMTQFVRYVRGNTSYGINNFVDNGNGTITDQATGLIWQQADSGKGMAWEAALSYCESSNTAGTSDWRLPNAKELQSIVDYTRSPDTTGSAAIDPMFSTTSFVNDLGQTDYPAFWTSTTHLDGRLLGENAVYVNFGESQGYMSFGNSSAQLMDVHGAGAQRSDPKTGNPDDYPTGHGPQGDVITIYNSVRCVRSGEVEFIVDTAPASTAAVANNTGQPPQNQNQNQGVGQPQAPGNDQQPPQQAIDACAGQIQGTSCQIDTPQGTLDGTCQDIQNTTACVPEGGPGGQQRPPGQG